MRRKMFRWFWAWDFDKEEKWLNEMAVQGLALVSVGFCTYSFEPCVPGEYQVRLELLENLPGNAQSQRYLEFLEETGAEYLGNVMRWAYFRKRVRDGTFDLFSDNASRIVHLNRMLALLGVIGLMEFSMALNNFSLYFGQHRAQIVNLVAAIVLAAVGGLIGFGFWKVLRIKRRLKKEQTLFE